MKTDVWCKKCGTRGILKRAARENETCPACDAPIWKRRVGSPTPMNHFGAVVRGVFSMRGVMFVIAYAFLVEIPHPAMRLAMAILLFLAATAFAARAMSVSVDRYIEFPHISIDEIFTLRAITAVVIYVFVLVLGPVLLIATSLASEFLPFTIPFAPPIPIAIGLAALLFLWTPMALVLYLRTGNVLGFFLLPQGIRLILLDVGGYVGLSFLVLFGQASLVGVYALNSVAPFPLTLLFSALKAFLILGVYGVAGLYVRQKARVLDFPCDDDDWVPAAPPIDVDLNQYRSFRPTNPNRAIELEDEVPGQQAREAFSAGAANWPPKSESPSSWPPSAALDLSPSPGHVVSAQARSVGIAPLAEGEWLSGPDVSDDPGAAPNFHAHAAEPVSGNDPPASKPNPVTLPGVGLVLADAPSSSPASEPAAPYIPPEARPPKEATFGSAFSSAAAKSYEVTETGLSAPGAFASAVAARSRETAAPVDGERLGRYRLVNKIAEGGMAEIYAAFQEGPQNYRKPVVLKRMLPRLTSDPEIVKMFLDEARLGALLQHPNIVQTVDFGEVDGEYYIALEALKGGDLNALVAQGTFPIDIAALIISQACDGLGYAHDLTDDDGNPRSIVHRDISPANIYVSKPGAVKVLDFGIAAATERSTKTQTGLIKGKPAYMSPEQVRGQPLDRRSDVFSLGTTLFQLVTGANPFHRTSDFDTGAAVVQERQKKPSELRGDIPEGFDEVIRGALRKHADRRFADMDTFRRALEPFQPAGSPSQAIARFLANRTQ